MRVSPSIFSTLSFSMATGKKTWNLCDGDLLTRDAVSAAVYKDKDNDDTSVSPQRSVSTTSITSTSSASSDGLFLKEKPFIKVPSHVATILAHRGIDVSAIGNVTWRDNSPLHSRNWSLARKLYDTAVVCFLEMFTTLVNNTGSSTAVAGTADLGSSAVIYLFSEAFPVVFKAAFGFNHGQCSLVNLVIPIGVVSTFLPRLYDIGVANDCLRRNIIAQPGDKIFGFLVAAPLLAVAFWWRCHFVRKV